MSLGFIVKPCLKRQWNLRHKNALIYSNFTNSFLRIYVRILRPVNVNSHDNCVPSPFPRLAGFPLIIITYYLQLLIKKYGMTFETFHSFRLLKVH